jgi:hypothetical protein
MRKIYVKLKSSYEDIKDKDYDHIRISLECLRKTQNICGPRYLNFNYSLSLIIMRFDHGLMHG